MFSLNRAFRRRRLMNSVSVAIFTLLTLASMAILVAIIGHIASEGLAAINLDFFTQIPKPVGQSGGGIAQAILGSLEMLLVGAIFAVPLGVVTAVYLSEFANPQWLIRSVRFCLDLIAGIPSIVVGVFVWALLVRYVTGYSGLAGSVALAIIMLPIIARIVEEMLRLVPQTIREAGLSLGLPRWRVIISIVIPSVLPGVITGIILGIARAAGETAPLLLTSLGNLFFNFDLGQPMAAMTLQAYNYAVSPYDDWQTKAWGTMLVLILVVAILSATVRFIGRRYKADV